MSVHRTAERPAGAATYHVLRGARYACGAKRDLDRGFDRSLAYAVEPVRRCGRIGCSNDYAKADREVVRL